MEEFRAHAKKALFYLLVERYVGASEAVDRLLRIADKKQLAGNGADSPPVCAAGIVGGKQKQDLGLEGIGVLKLVDEKVGEALLQVTTHAGVIANEVAGLDEEVQKIEPPGFRLENLIVGDRRLQSFVKQRREIRIAGRDEDIEIGLGPVAAGQDLIPQQSAEASFAEHLSSASS